MNKVSKLSVFSFLLSAIVSAQTFTPVFNPAGTVTNSKAMVSGDFDDDANRDIAVTSSIPNNRLVVFENTGDDSYSEVFSINAAGMTYLTYGDMDNDDNIEIIGSLFGSSVFNIVLFENTGNDQYVERNINISESGCSQCQLTKVMVADTDLDGNMEIIFSYKNSDFGTASKLYVYEHDAIAGVNSYSKVYEFTTLLDQSIESFTIGDADNDGQLEIIMGILNGTISRLENNGDNSFVLNQSSYSEPISLRDLHVADVDLDSDNELMIVGRDLAALNTGKIIIFESPADDQFTADFVMDDIGPQVKRIETFSDAQLSLRALGTFDGIIEVLEYKNQNYTSVLSNLLPVSSTYITNIEMGFIDTDNKVDLIVSSGAGEGLYIFEDDNNLLGAEDLADLGFTIWPIPAQDYIFLKKDVIGQGNLNIFSIDGKLIKKYPISTSLQQIDISFLQSGSYILQYIDSEKNFRFSYRLLKNHP